MKEDRSTIQPPLAPCPPWCVVDHRGAHPEDLIHQDAGVLVAAVVRPPGLARTGEPETLIVQRNRHLSESTEWIDIQSADEGSSRLVLSYESAERLLRALGTVLARS